MKNTLLTLGWGLLTTSGALAGTFNLNSVKGLWPMAGTLDSRWPSQPGLSTQGLAEPVYVTSGATSWLALASDRPPYGGLTPEERLVVPNHSGPNGPAAATLSHSWTLVMDVRFPLLDNWTSLLQSNPDNTSDAVIFIDPSRQLRLLGASGPAGDIASDPLSANTWYRLAFSAAYDAGSNRQILRAYVNGALTAQTAAGQTTVAPQGRYGLDSAFLLFSDNNRETAKVDVASVAFWGEALAASDLAPLGGVSGGELAWPDMIPADGDPPFTGALKFGNFTARFSPDLAALAASAQPPTLAGAVATLAIQLDATGGIVPGHPTHTFGGALTGQLMPNGDIVVDADSVTLNYAAPQGEPAADLLTLANVTYSRFRTQLTPQGAKTSLTVYLPPGFGVALDPLSKQTYAQASLADVALDANLLPPLTLDLNRENFGSGTAPGPVYPMVERVPVRFTARAGLLHPAITLTRDSGDFAFTSAADLLFHREPQIQALLAQVAAELPGAVVPASNDFYFVAAKTVGSQIHIRARDGDGSAMIQALSMSLDPTKFGAAELSFYTHYPRMFITWNDVAGSNLVFAGGAIDAAQSGLAGASFTSMNYATGVPTKSCDNTLSAPPVATETVWFHPQDGVWRFTPDGGLQAGGILRRENLGFTGPVVRWGQFTAGGANFYVNEIKTGFDTARVMTAGVAVPDGPLAGLEDWQKPAALWLSGFGSPSDATLAERPGSDAYYDGLAAYPGVNLRCTDASYGAVSRLANQAVPAGEATYPLAGAAKYCLRPSGVTGRHLAAADAPPIQFALFGSVFELSRLSLGYREGVNVSSGVNGFLLTDTPSKVKLFFKSLRFGTQGQLLAPALDDDKNHTDKKVLGPDYWALEFEPLALDFPQPAGCPQAAPDVGFIRISAQAKLTAFGDQSLSGSIGILNGDLVAETDPVANAVKSISRFIPGGHLEVAGPNSSNTPWSVNPVGGIALNKFNPHSSGTLTVAGLLDVPFFTDMGVVLSTESRNSGSRPDLFVRQPWEALDSGHYDADHRGTPPGTPLADYRIGDAFDPHATRTWKNGISFDLPVHLEATRVFRSRSPVPDQPLLLFNLTEEVRSMTPEATELTFAGGEQVALTDVLTQVNLASLLSDSGLLKLPAGELKTGLDGALASVRGLDNLLADQLQGLLRPGLDAAAARAATPAFLVDLGHRKHRLSDLREGLAASLQGMVSFNATGGSATWLSECAARVGAARSGFEQARLLVKDAGQVQALATAIGRVLQLDAAPAAPDPVQFAAIQAQLDQIIAQLSAIEGQLAGGGALAGQLNAAMPPLDELKALVDLALGDLQPKWEALDDACDSGFLATATVAELTQDLAAALTDRVAGSAYAGSFTQLLRQYAADPQMLARQAIDDTLRMAGQLVAGRLPGPEVPGLGALHDTMAAASLQGSELSVRPQKSQCVEQVGFPEARAG